MRILCLVQWLAVLILLPSAGGAQTQRCTTVATGAGVQVGGCTSGSAGPASGLPQNVQLPRGDFVWNWGTRPVDDDPDPYEFSIEGTEERFFCRLTGTFQAAFPRGVGDRSVWLRDFVAALSTTQRFIRDATEDLNRVFRDGSDSSWATLRCLVREFEPTDEDLQEEADKALERAERQRDRRREQ